MLAPRLHESLILWTQGGLGNQLFQLCGGIDTSQRSGLPILISRSSFLRDKLRSFAIGPIIARNEILSWPEEFQVGWPYRRSGKVRVRTVMSRLMIQNADDLAFEPVQGSLILGYFQGSNHEHIDTSLVSKRLRSYREGNISQGLIAKTAGQTVAHVRRTDYQTSEAARARFGALGPGYYLRAFKELDVHPGEVIFFTDDVGFVASAFGASRARIVGPSDTDSDLEAMLAMSAAKQLIIANSTFSWWAAEVSDAVNVCAPEFWFRNAESQTLARQDWLRVRND